MTPLTTSLIILSLLAAATLGLAWMRSRRENARLRSELAANERHLGEQLEQTRAQSHDWLNALNDAFLLIDSQSIIRFANQAALRLCHSRQLQDRSLREAFTDPRITNALNECLQAPATFSTCITLPQSAITPRDHEAAGESAWMFDSLKIPADDGTSPAWTRIIIRDITTEHLTEQIRKDFVANASHELRTPMAIISGYLENLIDDNLIEDHANARRFLEIMRKHSDRMSRIIEDMLMISRLESGTTQQLNLERFPLAEVFQDVIDRLESMIRKQEALVQIKLPPDTPITIEGDRFYWVQCLFNLVENALKQNPRPGLAIELGAQENNDHFQIWISDNGVGIPAGDLPHVFRRFYRVDKQHHQSAIKGTGLGLSIVKRAIEAHGGTITAQSSPGIETRFLITLPKNPPNRDNTTPNT